MTENEYREFLTFLFERYIRPRIARVRHRYARHFEDEMSYHLDQAVRSVRVFRFVESYCDNDDDVYETFTLERLSSAVSETRYSLEFANRLVDDAGFLDACESHAREIADGLEAAYLPDADKDVLREMGSVNPEVELRTLVFLAKILMQRNDSKSHNAGLRQQLRYADERSKEWAAEFEKYVKAKKEGSAEDVPKKTRRWFKGLGQIGLGAALSIENVALAIGTLHLPVSPETQTWGAITSVTTGVGTIVNGIGELRNE
jgi:hypothetical protein